MSSDLSSSSAGSGFRISRRRLLQGAGAAAVAAALGGGGGAAAAALSGKPGPASGPSGRYVLPEGFTGTMADLKHVVVMMKENRSFDHYLGQLPGVRGQGDKQVLRFQDGTDVFQQPTGTGTVETPYEITTQTQGDLDHSFWSNNNRQWNDWIPAKGSSTMEYLAPTSMPWLYSLASQYTVCDQYFCSMLGSTIPNRLYLMSGTCGGTTSNANQNLYLYSWVSLADQLEQAGLDWRVYSDNSGNGLGGSIQSGFIGEYGCNVVNCFKSFDPRTASPADLAPLGKIWRGNSYLYADTGVVNNDSDENLQGVLSTFIAACQPGAQYPLSAISFIVMPASYSEHPSFEPVEGDRYLQTVLAALQSNSDIWNHTLLIINFDENDGLFDHVLPPTPDASVTDEFIDGTPIGLGARVPAILVSPWTRGGYVASEVFDHTSVIRFLEVWAAYLGMPFTNPNITAWRRSITGDFTSAIDFAHPQLGPVTVADPVTGTPPVVVTDQMKPRDISYSPHAVLTEDRAAGAVTASMTLAGGPDGKAVSIQVFPDKYQAFSNTPFTVTAARPQQYTWDATKTDGSYAFSMYGPDGFIRSFAGQIVPAQQRNIGIPRVGADLLPGADAKVRLTLHNDGMQPVRYVLAANDYLGGTQTVFVSGGQSTVVEWPTQEGYYDVIITADTGTGWTQRYAGRVATV